MLEPGKTAGCMVPQSLCLCSCFTTSFRILTLFMTIQIFEYITNRDIFSGSRGVKICIDFPIFQYFCYLSQNFPIQSQCFSVSTYNYHQPIDTILDNDLDCYPKLRRHNPWEDLQNLDEFGSWQELHCLHILSCIPQMMCKPNHHI